MPPEAPLPSEVFAGDGDSTLMDLMDTAHVHDHNDGDDEKLKTFKILGIFSAILMIFRMNCVMVISANQRGVKDLLFAASRLHLQCRDTHRSD